MRSIVSGVLLAVALVGCGGSSSDAAPDDLVGTTAEVHAYDGWTTATDGSTVDVNLRVHNAGPTDDRLLGATCSCGGTVTIDGAVVVGPEEEVVLAPGGTPGVRLTELDRPLRADRFVTLTLTFEQAGEVTAEIEVRDEGPQALGYPKQGRQATDLAFRCL